ncbi:hypothetical protein BH24PSE2_BH24PSE2_21420 [soil metagenome]
MSWGLNTVFLYGSRIWELKLVTREGVMRLIYGDNASVTMGANTFDSIQVTDTRGPPISSRESADYLFKPAAQD